MTDYLEARITELAAVINFYVGAWHEFGYENPPSPECKAIPPLGQRSADAAQAGHQAVKEIDALIATVHRLRTQLVSELRKDEDLHNKHIDKMLVQPRPGSGLFDPQATCRKCGAPIRKAPPRWPGRWFATDRFDSPDADQCEHEPRQEASDA